MGIFRDLMQEEEMEEQRNRANTLEERVELLEEQLGKTRTLLRKTLKALENHIQKDGDGTF